MIDAIELKKLEELCHESRKNILSMVFNAQSGHIGGALSAVEIMTVLFHKCMKTVPQWKNDVDFAARDRFVLSKGHASSIFLLRVGAIRVFPKRRIDDI